MKKLLFIFLLLSVKVFAQEEVKSQRINDQCVYIKGKKFEGIAFDEKYIYLFAGGNQKFTPTTNDIILAERILIENIANINDTSNQKLFIRKNLKKYYRQYVGYINDQNEKVIFINFFGKNLLIKHA
jgi:hypothetical protein